MYSIGEKIIYGEYGVCTVMCIAPLDSTPACRDKLYYHLEPLIGTGTFFSPIDSPAYMRPIISREQAEALLESISEIEPAICTDNRFNHVDAFYKELFRKHSCEALVSILKGLRGKLADKKNKSSRAEITMKRARDMLNGELSIALDMDIDAVDSMVQARL